MNGQEQRDKVETMISLGTPYLGSPTMTAFWIEQDPNMLLVNQTDFMDGWEDWQKGLWALLVEDLKSIDAIVGNFKSIYEMIPTRKYFDDNYANRDYLVTSIVGLIPISADTYDYTISELTTHLPYFKRDLAECADLFHSSLYINGSHITSLVDAYYISGLYSDGLDLDVSRNTVDGLMWNLSGWKVITRTEHGDLMVPAWSADLANKYPDKTFYVSGESHTGLIYNTQVLGFINRLISQNVSISGYNNISMECPY